MKKLNILDNIDPVAFINDQIWEGYNILRGDVSANDFNFILYLTVLKSRDILPNLDVDEDMENVLTLPEIDLDEINDSEEKAILQLLFIVHDTFKEVSSHLRNKTWSALYTLFKDIDSEILKENLEIIFEEQLSRLVKLQGKAGGYHYLPNEISKFLIELADLPNESTIYNPFAGIASLGLHLNHSQVYIAQEHDIKAYTTALLRIIAHRKVNRSFIFNQNSLKVWGFKSPTDKSKAKSFLDSFDLVITTPPFNTPVKGIEGQSGQVRTLEQFSIENGITVLKETGKLIAIVSPNFLSTSSGPELKLREFLVKSDLLDMVIMFPGGLLPHTSIRCAAIVLNKNKKNKGLSRFIDAKDYAISISRVEKKLNVDALLNTINSKVESDISRDVTIQDIEASDFSFNPARYLLAPTIDPDSPIRALGEVVKIKPRESSIQPGTKGKFIRIRDLKSDPTNIFVNWEDIEFSDIPPSAMEIKNASLLLALRFSNLKPSLINGSKERVFVTADILPLHVFEDKIDPAYLVSELNSDFVKRQVEAYSYGSTIQSISKKDILNLRIRVPNKEEQRARVNRIREEILKSKHRELELTREMLGLKDDSFREFASIKHTLSQYLNALKTNVSGTIKFISRNQEKAITLDSMYSINLNQNLGDHLISLEQTIDSMSRLLQSAGSELDKPELPAFEMEMDLSTLIKNAQNRFKNPDVFLYEELYIDKESFTWDGEVFIAPLVNILADDFYRIFSNIIANAIDHGFKGRINNVIRTSLSHDWDNAKLILEISNNGHPLPDAFTLKHLTTRGEKTTDSKGLGIGGADIKALLDKYNATLDLRNEPGEEFPVTYVLSFDLAMTLL